MVRVETQHRGQPRNRAGMTVVELLISLVIFAIIIISVMPMVIEFLRSRREATPQ